MPFRPQSTPLSQFIDKLPQKSGLLSQIGILSKDLDKDMWGNICTLDIFLMGHYLEEDEFEKFQKIHDEYLHCFVYFCVNSRYYLVLADNLARTEEVEKFYPLQEIRQNPRRSLTVEELIIDNRDNPFVNIVH